MPGPPKDILHAPQNRFCADCGARDPRWASVNLGIFICEVCAGIHRNLGTHISQVRSITLDAWKPEWVDTVRRIGNGRAKAYYEHSVPERERFSSVVELAGGDRIDSEMARVLENWIRRKYQEQRFAPPGVPELLREPAVVASPLAQGVAAGRTSPRRKGAGNDGRTAQPQVPARPPAAPHAQGEPWPSWPTAPSSAAGRWPDSPQNVWPGQGIGQVDGASPWPAAGQAPTWPGTAGLSFGQAAMPPWPGSAASVGQRPPAWGSPSQVSGWGVKAGFSVDSQWPSQGTARAVETPRTASPHPSGSWDRCSQQPAVVADSMGHSWNKWQAEDERQKLLEEPGAKPKDAFRWQRAADYGRALFRVAFADTD
mmetsp:Transcript_27673/g.76134  ORF Transcript_27673/g.76134 Transcript_27673/m.76134 type:complete len:369 (-) Transcript_27673:445-1551(-)